MKPRPNTFFSALLYLALPGALLAQEADSAIVVPSGLDTSVAPAVLNYNLKVGTQYDASMNIAQQMSMMGQPIQTDITMGMNMDVKEGGDAAAKRVDTSFTQMGMDMDAMGTKMSYDSSNPDDATGNPLAAMGQIVGKKFSLLLDADNQVTAVEGLDEIQAALGDNPVAQQSIGTMLNEESMKQLANEWTRQVLPKEAVKPGDTWPFTYTAVVTGMGEMAYSGDATLHGYTKVDGADVAVIELDGMIDTSKFEPQGQQGQMMKSMGMTMEGGKSRSILYWDNTLGYFRKMEAEQGMAMKMKNPQTGEEILMPIKQTMKTDVDVK